MLAITLATILSTTISTIDEYLVLHPGSVAQVYFDDTPVLMGPYEWAAFNNTIDITGSAEPCPWTLPFLGQLQYSGGAFSLAFPYHYSEVVATFNFSPWYRSQFREIEFLSGYETFTKLPALEFTFTREYRSEWCSFEK